MTQPGTLHSSGGRHRVVITGGGIVTGLGCGWGPNEEGFFVGRVAFGPVTLFDVSRHRARTAAEVRMPELPATGGLAARRFRTMDRAGKLLLLAAREAVGMAAVRLNEVPDPVPVVVATTSAGMGSGEAFFRQALSSAHARRGQATRLMDYYSSRHLLDLSEDLGFRGSFTTLANACASGANAVGHAYERVRSGESPLALAGGYDALSHLVFAGFDALQALSVTTCRPFDRNRDGLGLGEGAAMLVLETESSARARGARILAEVAGYGLSTDLHHLTQPHPEGRAAAASMRAACAVAGVSSREIGYINAHGTGTPHNDASESAAIAAWAGDDVDRLAVSSTKSSVGHLLGAAGAVEAVVCVMALLGQRRPPTSTVQEIDPACRFRVVREPEEATGLDVVLSNSFGFGGSNATLVLRRWHE